MIQGRKNSGPRKGIPEQRRLLRKLYTKDVREKIQQAQGNQYSAITTPDAKQDVAHLLWEEEKADSAKAVFHTSTGIWSKKA